MAFDFNNINDNSNNVMDSLLDYATCLEKEAVMSVLMHDIGFPHFDQDFTAIKYTTKLGWIYSLENFLMEHVNLNGNNGIHYYKDHVCGNYVYRKNKTISAYLHSGHLKIDWMRETLMAGKRHSPEMRLKISNICYHIFGKKDLIPAKLYVTNDDLIYIVGMPHYVETDETQYIYNDFICFNPNKIDEVKAKYFKLKDNVV